MLNYLTGSVLRYPLHLSILFFIQFFITFFLINRIHRQYTSYSLLSILTQFYLAWFQLFSSLSYLQSFCLCVIQQFSHPPLRIPNLASYPSKDIVLKKNESRYVLKRNYLFDEQFFPFIPKKNLLLNK